MSKTSLNNTATVVITKTQGKKLRAPLTKVSAQPPPVNTAFDLHYKNLLSEISDLKRQLNLAHAKLNKFVVNPVTHVVTYTP